MSRRVHRLLSWSVVLVLVVAGLVTSAPSASASQAPVELVGVTSVSIGNDFGCAVRTDGTAVCFTIRNPPGFPQVVPPVAPDGPFTLVTVGYNFACGLRPGGAVVCWGGNANGQLDAPTDSFSTISAGAYQICGLTTDGHAVCWGQGSNGQTLAPQDTSFLAVDAGVEHSCGLTTDHHIRCWGSNSFDQLTVPAGTYQAVTAGGYHSCGLRDDGSVTCWGDNRFDQSTAPVEAFTAISAGRFHTCGLLKNGTVSCWGSNTWHGNLPDGPFGTLPSTSTDDSCALHSDQTAACWGNKSEYFLIPPAAPAPAPPAATVGSPYSHTFTSDRGNPAGAFAVTAGTLPAGLTLSPEGVLSGTPTGAAASTSFTVTVSDGILAPATVTFTLSVRPAPDSTPPVTTVSLSPSAPNGTNGWYTGPVTATVSPTDSGSGVDQTRCVLDPAGVPATFSDLPAGCDFTNPVSGQGQHTVYAASKDKAGNTEAVRAVSFKIDSVKPTLAPTLPDHVYLHQTGLTATPGASDATSGVASQSCGPIDTTTAGDHVLTCQASDNAGNQASVQVHYTVEYKVQGLSLPLPGSTLRAGGTVPVTAALTDVNGALIPNAEAAALAKACRVTFSATGAQTSPTQCLAYEPITHQFYALWKTAKSPTGTETVTVTVTYPGTSTTTTKPTTFTLAR